MRSTVKRATVYFDARIHKLLKLKAVETAQSISEIVNAAVQRELAADANDLEVFGERESEPSISYEAMLKELKRDGKI